MKTVVNELRKITYNTDDRFSDYHEQFDMRIKFVDPLGTDMLCQVGRCLLYYDLNTVCW